MKARTRMHTGWILFVVFILMMGAFTYWLYHYQKANQDRSYSGAKFVDVQAHPAGEQSHGRE